MNDKQTDKELRKILQKQQPATPSIITSRIDETLDRLPEKNTRKKYRRYPLLIAVIGFVLLLGLSAISPTLSNAMKEIPVIGSVFQAVGNLGLQDVSEQGLTEQIHESAKDNGVTITIHEVLYDGAELSIGYVVEAEHDLTSIYDIQLFADNERIYSGGGGRGEQMNENQLAEIRNFTVREDLPEEFTLRIQINSLSGVVNGEWQELKGNWHFTFPVVKLQEGVVSYDFDEKPSKSHQNETMIVNRATFTPAMAVIYLNFIEPYDQVPRAEVDFHINRGFQVIDDRGMILESVGQSSSGSLNQLQNTFEREYQIKLAPLSRIPKFVTIRTYTESLYFDQQGDHGETVTSTAERLDPYDTADLSSELPIVLNQGAAGDLTITKIERSDELIVLHYEVSGENNPHRQANTIMIEDEDGERYHTEPMDILRTDDSTYSFKAAFPITNQQQQLHVITFEVQTLDFQDELEMTIPIK